MKKPSSFPTARTCVNRKQLQLLLVALATPPALSCLPAWLHLHLFSNQISNEIFIKLINISAGLSQASLLRYRAVDASNACAAAPADVPASDWPRLKYALGIIRAAARNLPHTRIYQTAGDAEFDKCVRRKKKTLHKERGQRGQRLCQNGAQGGAWHFVDNKTIKRKSQTRCQKGVGGSEKNRLALPAK